MGMGRTHLTVGRIERAREALRLVILTPQTRSKYAAEEEILREAWAALARMQTCEEALSPGKI